MNTPPRLVLKQPTGWFAAGWEFGEALLCLSDAASRLFAWVCLNADRHTGQLRAPVAEIARVLRRPGPWAEAALRELDECGVCRWTAEWIEVADAYWPYEKQGKVAAQDYVAQVRRLLLAPACVRCRFTAADERLARDLERRGVTLTQIERAIWLGCVRKYTTSLANGAASMPIASLGYFSTIIAEVCENGMADSYWAYIQRKAAELERQWLSRERVRPSA
jgi:hypothetical protein